MVFDCNLCLQGGAMRSVFTDGVLDCLIDNNILFKNIYGISASSKDMFYYAAMDKESAYKANILCATDPNTFNMSNALLGKPVINTKYYIEEIRNKKYPYNLDKINELGINLYIGCTNIDSISIEYFKAPCDNLDLKIEASCSLPVIQPIIEIDNKRYLDGGIVENIPLSEALKNNKKIIVVTTREKGFKSIESQTSAIENQFIKMTYQDNQALVNKLLNRNNDYDMELKNLDELESKNQVFVIRPSVAPNISRLERDTNKLKELYQDGYNTMLKNLEKLFSYLK